MNQKEKDSVTRRTFLDSTGKTMAGGLCIFAFTPVTGGAEAAKARRQGTYGAYCGLYCGACKNLYESERARKSSEVKCLGCKDSKNAGHCAKCEIRACARRKRLEYCAECDEYPCDKLKAFHLFEDRDYRILGQKNCEFIHEKGGGAWLAERKERWTCPNCHERFTWKDEKCPNCRKDVLSCTEEAAAWRSRKG